MEQINDLWVSMLKVLIGVLFIVIMFGVFFVVQRIQFESKKQRLKEQEFDEMIEHTSNVNLCMEKVLEYIDSYKPRFKVQSRFLFDIGIMKEVFPEFSEEVHREVFNRLITKEKVRRNPIDQDWELTPPSWSETRYQMKGEQIPKNDMEKIIEPGGIQ